MMIEMFSDAEYLLFFSACCFIVCVVLMVYLLVELILSLISDRIYYHYKRKAIKELKQCLRQIRIEHERNYVKDFEMLYSTIKEGEKNNENL